MPRRRGADLRDLLGGADRAVGGAARGRAAAAAAHPVAHRARPRRVGPEFGLAIGEMRRFAAGALAALAPYDAVLTPTLAVPPLPVGAIRDDDDPAADFEAQKAFTPVDVGLERHRHAGRLAAAALDARRPAGRRDAGRPARRGGAAARRSPPRSRPPPPGTTAARPAGEVVRSYRRTVERRSGDLAADHPADQVVPAGWMRSSGICLDAGLLDEHDHLQRGEQGGGEEGDVAADVELGSAGSARAWRRTTTAAYDRSPARPAARISSAWAG